MACALSILVLASNAQREQVAYAAPPGNEEEADSDKAIFAAISQHPKTLILSGNKISPTGTQALSQFSELTSLSVRSCPHFSLNNIKNLKRLRILSVENVNLADSISELEAFPLLQSLELSGAGITDSSLVHVNKLQTLLRLDLRSCPISDAGVVQLRGLKNLKHIGLAETDAGDGSIAMLASNCPALTSLAVGRQATDDGVISICRLERLTDLALSNSRVTSTGVSKLQKLKTLHALSLAGGAISDSSLVALRGMPLNTLHCDGISRSPDGLIGVAHLQGIVYLSLTNSPYTDEDIRVLKQMPKLKFLWLDGTNVTKESLGLLRQFPSLVHVTLFRTKIDAVGADQLREDLFKKIPRGDQ
ncbi:MAG: hypothetical protein K8T91_18965 [Planctomycetes bacterium]|nr:hypothetical protein [Planctomycetota bacterium]